MAEWVGPASQEAPRPDVDHLPSISPDAHKYNRGVVGVIAGSDAYAGAAVLCVGGARRGGAGYVRFIERSTRASMLVLHAFPDVVVTGDASGRVDAWAIGSGTTPDEVRDDLQRLMATRNTLVIDGGALTLVTARQEGITVVTPHEGEAAAMGFTLEGVVPVSGAIHDEADALMLRQEQRRLLAVAMAQQLNAIVVLKGHRTVIAAPDGTVHTDQIGGPELSTAGTGDILAGLIASMLAAWRPTLMRDTHGVVVKAVAAHGAAGRAAANLHRPVVATDVLDALGSPY
jgi:ADP-dependent NAD(P)H-hydrate dehydratase / NAD(P)H-hydrate epimerase